MIIAIDFDHTLVEDAPYDASTTLKLKPRAREAVTALKRAGHILVLWSGRTNRSLMYLAEFNPLVRNGVVGDANTDETRELHAARYRQMLEFIELELPGVFDAIDDGRQGKVEADMYIDDRALSFGPGASWRDIELLYGE